MGGTPYGSLWNVEADQPELGSVAAAIARAGAADFVRLQAHVRRGDRVQELQKFVGHSGKPVGGPAV